MLLWITNPPVSMMSFTLVLTVQWSDTIPSQNVQLFIRIHLTWFCFNIRELWPLALLLEQANADHHRYGSMEILVKIFRILWHIQVICSSWVALYWYIDTSIIMRMGKIKSMGWLMGGRGGTALWGDVLMHHILTLESIVASRTRIFSGTATSGGWSICKELEAYAKQQASYELEFVDMWENHWLHVQQQAKPIL